MAAYTISHQDLGRMKNEIVSRDHRIVKSEEARKRDSVVNKGLAVGEALLGAFGFCYLRGQMEDPNTGAWNVPGTSVDVEAITFLGLTAAAFAAQYYKPAAAYGNHVAYVAAGIGGHYAGQLGRKMGRTGKFSLVAGVPGIGGVPGVGGLPQYDPLSLNNTQFSAPYADEVEISLASSGI